MSQSAVHQWADRGRMPLGKIKPLCELGHNIVSPLDILDAIAREEKGGAGE